MNNASIKRWVQSNWFKIGIMLFFIIALLLLVYYVEQSKYHKLTIECRNLGEKIGKDLNPPPAGGKMMSEYYFNPKLNKCFYCGGYTGNGFLKETIIDVYTNKEIVSYMAQIKNPDEGEIDSRRRFIRLKRLLFGEIKNPQKHEIDLMRQSIE